MLTSTRLIAGTLITIVEDESKTWMHPWGENLQLSSFIVCCLDKTLCKAYDVFVVLFVFSRSQICMCSDEVISNSRDRHNLPKEMRTQLRKQCMALLSQIGVFMVTPLADTETR